MHRRVEPASTSEEAGPPIDVEIVGLSDSGEGIASDSERRILVPLTVPGDRVRVSVGPGRGDPSRAQVVDILNPGRDRIPPPCRHVGTCGGCDWQHVDLEAQRTAKRERIQALLQRFAVQAEVAPVVASPLDVRYRRRMRVRVQGGRWGLSGRRSGEFVMLDACLLAEESVQRHLEAAAVEVRRWSGVGIVESVGVETLSDGAGAWHVALGQVVTPALRKAVERSVADGRSGVDLRGVVLTDPTGTAVCLGEPVLVDPAEGGLHLRPDLFAQANRLGARRLALDTAATVESGSRVLELYAGVGTLTRWIAPRAASLIATEGDGPALELSRRMLDRAGLRARLLTGPAQRIVTSLSRELEAGSVDHIVLDPPRTGAGDVVPLLSNLSASRVTYVSCDPVSWARDVLTLERAGWRLRSVVPHDLFPHTHHVELLSVLER